MTLTPEQIDLLNRLQPFFRKKMGKAQRGDEYAFEVLPDDWRTEFHNEMDNFFTAHIEAQRQRQGYNTLCIPKVIDWQNPERELWGSVDWNKQHGKIMPDGEIGIFSIPYFEHHQPKFKADPFTALLKALAEQEEV